MTPEELPSLTDPATTLPVSPAGFKYWKLAIFKGLNGYFMAVAMAFLAFTDGDEWKIDMHMRTLRLVLFCLVAGHKFLDGFFDQTFSLLKSLKEQYAAIAADDQGMHRPVHTNTHFMKVVKTLLVCSVVIIIMHLFTVPTGNSPEREAVVKILWITARKWG